MEVVSSNRLKAIIGGSVGNLVEWYDWYTYAAFSIYFAPYFFPHSSPTAQLLNSAGIFAVGFFMRPFGGWLFGSIGDQKGRKTSMTISVLLMSLGSLIIACIPGYDTIGVAAPVLLVLARMVQGLSLGGEYGSSATYLSEMAQSHRRGFYSSFQYVTLIGGQLIALGIQLILQQFILTESQLLQWGWRIPFFIGAILSVVAFYIRNNLQETDHFKKINIHEKDRGTIKMLLLHPKAILTVIGLTLGGTVAFYTYSIYMQKFLVNTVHLTKSQSTLVSFTSLFVFAVVQPLFGLLSDHMGRKPLLIGFGILGSILTVPLLSGLSRTTTAPGAFIFIMAGLFIVSGYTSINAIVKAELYPSAIRTLGVGLPYAVTTAIFGGTAEYIALWFKNRGNESYFYWYVSFCILVSLIVYLTMQDTKTNSRLND